MRFPVNIAKFLRTPFFTERLRLLLENVFLRSSRQEVFYKRGALERCFPVNFAKFL